ncbi:hypothetical protein ACFQS7_29300 [Dankookia sp. GCM10030260]|uniref:hypothetical protein n=1 Tax=Dankookia sp. GCM10030260 TaxID=3273390 RepID=UPI003608DDC0
MAALKAIADQLDLDIPLEGLGLPVPEGEGPMILVAVAVPKAAMPGLSGIGFWSKFPDGGM